MDSPGAHYGAAPHTPSARGPRPDFANTPNNASRLQSSPYPSTPAVERLTTAELQFALKDAWRLVREKERDCALAAEIGSKLLEANEKLKAQYERVLEDYEAQKSTSNDTNLVQDVVVSPSNPGGHGKARPHAHGEDLTVNHVFELEKLNQELQQKIDGLAFNNAELERAGVLHEKKLEDLTMAHKRELGMALNAIRELEADKNRLAQEKAEAAKQFKDGKKHAGAEAAYVARIDELEDIVADLTSRTQNAESRLDPALKETEMWSTRCRDLEERCDGIETLQDECALQQCRIDELEGKLSDERELVATLKAVLNGEKALPPNPSMDIYDEDENSHSLFSEVEDKRQALESRHHQLAAKHKGLIRVHHQNVHQQERMRNHISRLTQLTQSRTDEERLHRLEQALGEKDSENRALFARIAALERGGPAADPGLGGTGSGAGTADSQTVETLRLRLSTLEFECEYLRGEVRTLKMLRVGEIEKLRKTERALGDKEEEIERIRNEAAKWKWEAEEAKVLLEEKERMVELISDTQIEVVESGNGEQKRRRHIAAQTEEDWTPASSQSQQVSEQAVVDSFEKVALDSELQPSPADESYDPEDAEAEDPAIAPNEFTIRSIRHDLDSDTSSSSASGSLNMDNTFSNVTSAYLKAGHTQTRGSMLVAVTNNNMRRERERTMESRDFASPAGGDLAPQSSSGFGGEPTPLRSSNNRDPLSDASSSLANVTASTGPRRQRVPTAERKEDPASEPAPAPVKRPESIASTGSALREPIGMAAGSRAPKQVFVNKKGGSSAPSSAEAKKQEECKQQ